MFSRNAYYTSFFLNSNLPSFYPFPLHYGAIFLFESQFQFYREVYENGDILIILGLGVLLLKREWVVGIDNMI